MKTAIQQLIERLEEEDINVPFLIKSVYIEKEKKQIIEAHEEGFYSPPFKKSRRGEAEEYYNQTYNQNK
jgi:hypothetical protein